MSMIAGERPSRLVILGHPVAHSLSPLFQGAALAAAGLTQSYERVDVAADQLDAALATCCADHVGGNITLPHKEAVAARSSRLSGPARRAGAVNTFWFDRGLLWGHNTDVDGARASIQALGGGSQGSPGALHAVLIGSGGSAAAVLLALAEMGTSRVSILARTPARAHALLTRVGIGGRVIDSALDHETGRALGEADLVINCTPLGLRDTDPPPATLAQLSPRAAVFDLVYRPGSEQGTTWVRAARAQGHPAEDGLRMLVEQGAAAFETWFGIPAPREVMWHALNTAMPAADRPRSGHPH